MAQWYGGMTHTNVNLPGGGADYFVIEATFTGRVPVWGPRDSYTPVNVPYIYPLPGKKSPALPGLAVGLTPCLGGFGGFLSLCPKAPTPPSGDGGAMVVPFTDYYKSTTYQIQKWRPVTVAVSYIYARNGASFIAVSVGPSTGQTKEQEFNGSVAFRYGYFNSAQRLSSDEIDKELTGGFTEVGGAVNGFQATVVRNAGSGGLAVEVGKEAAFTEEPFGGEVLTGWSWQISGP
jgi:hypothetical protein